MSHVVGQGPCDKRAYSAVLFHIVPAEEAHQAAYRMQSPSVPRNTCPSIKLYVCAEVRGGYQ
jgi:hypothetical protein